jgi:predicted nucleotidyltransferase
MSRSDVLAMLSSHYAEMVQRFGVRSLALFGSVARDEAGPESDVDVLVDFGGPARFLVHMELVRYLEGLLGRRVDVLTERSLKPRLRERIRPDLVHVS